MNEADFLVEIEIDAVKFSLKEWTDFAFLTHFGQVFCVFDQSDSGNISFGVENATGEKYFIKVAGAQTVESVCEPIEAVKVLKKAVKVYKDLEYERLIKLVSFGTFGNLFYLVFDWVEGECLFDHWNFAYYHSHPEIQTPKMKLRELKQEKKEKIAKQLLAFLKFVEAKDYVVVDFYDGSLLYDFEKDSLMICDIDFFRKMPIKNNIGANYWGSARIKAPEEYQLGADIDTRTNIFTLGALLFTLFGDYSTETIGNMYEKQQFITLDKKDWLLAPHLYDTLLKAVSLKPNERFQTIIDFEQDWSAEHE